MDEVAWMYQQDPARMKPIEETHGEFVSPISEELLKEIWNYIQDGNNMVGDTLPWESDFRFKPKTLNVWAGINAHGKSVALQQCALHWAVQGKKTAIWSQEMPCETVYANLIRQATAVPKPTELFHALVAQWLNDWVMVWHQPSMRFEDVFTFLDAAKKQNIDHVIIDNLTSIGLTSDNLWMHQRELIVHHKKACMELGLIIHVVHHVRKLDSEKSQPDKFDVVGSGDITNLADNVFIVNRNIQKQEMVAEGLGSMPISSSDMRPWSELSDGLISAVKVRYGQPCRIKLWWNQIGPDTGAFTDGASAPSRVYFKPPEDMEYDQEVPF